MSSFEPSNVTIIDAVVVYSADDPGNVTTTVAEDSYDSEGAMKFIVCTVVVYAVMGVLCLLLSGIKKTSGSEPGSDPGKPQADVVSRYLKQQRQLRMDGYRWQLRSQCAQYTEKIRAYEEKVSLLQIQRNLNTADFGLAKITEESKGLSKKERKRRRKQRPNMSSVLGTAGFSLFYFPQLNNTGQSESETEADSAMEEAVVSDGVELGNKDSETVVVADENHVGTDSLQYIDESVT